MTEWIYKWSKNGWVASSGYAVANKELIQETSDLDDRVADLGTVKYIWIPREQNTDADDFVNEIMDEHCT